MSNTNKKTYTIYAARKPGHHHMHMLVILSSSAVQSLHISDILVSTPVLGFSPLAIVHR